jgi:roadblock/LC7 domain-containing protein
MGLFSSKPVGTPAPTAFAAPKIDTNLAQYRASDVSAFEAQAAAQVNAANKVITDKAAEITKAASTINWRGWAILVVSILALAAIAIVLYDTFAPASWPNIFFERTSAPAPPTSVSAPTPQTPGSCPTPPSTVSSTAPTKSPTIYSRLLSFLSGSNASGDLLPRVHNAMTSRLIAASNAPMSAEKEGAYGMQWWMFIEDWNYGYGKEKFILKRQDPTNGLIVNPSVSLLPTDNTMRVTVSLFPTTEGASKTTPAPAGDSGATDDVFYCDVKDVPLQSWFSVSVTVFGRNVDVYIDGKLVKSCFLPGVPKPAAGDILLTPDGGFSGKMCNFYHMPRMLTPGDAMSFYAAGTPCSSLSASSTLSSATGYSVKFGVYDALGKEIQEYAF